MSSSITDTINNAEKPESPKETDKDAISRLAEISPIEYDRVRVSEAERLGVRIGTLDKQVSVKRKELNPESDTDELTQGIEPWPEPVNVVHLADEIRERLNRYCALPEDADVALSLWVLASYTINSFRIFPKVCLSSPEKRCGKTTTLEVIGALAHRTLIASNLSPSVLFRSIDSWQPSLLIDEADTFLHGNDELRGVINSGHTRSGAFVLRTVGDSGDLTPAKFSTWAPMVISMIKTPPDTIRDRSIMILLRRKLPRESVEKLPFDLADDHKELRQKCKRWSEDYAENLKLHSPEVPTLQSDRAMDNWLPLLSIADLIGGEWPNLARNAMLKVEQVEESEEGVGPMILNDVREVFQRRNMDKVFSDDLVQDLIDMEERPWCEWRHGKPITKNSLAKLLKPFGISSSTIRINVTTRKGYYLNKFQDAFDRYLSIPTVPNVTPSQVNNDGGYGRFQNVTSYSDVTLGKALQPNDSKECGGVTFQKGGKEGSGANQEEFIL